MILGIDAASIRAGGGLTHLTGLLRVADPPAFGFEKVIVWGGEATLRAIEERPWLVKSFQPSLDKPLPVRVYWQYWRLSALVRQNACDILFVPGGTFPGPFRPFVTMSQNLLPFESRELLRFGFSWMALKCILLRISQGRTFRKADGLIYLSRYARDTVTRVLGNPSVRAEVIAHGVDPEYFCAPRVHLFPQNYSINRPFRLLYVSTVDMYKHQWRVVEAVAFLRGEGFPLVLELIGPSYPPALEKLMGIISKCDPKGCWVSYAGVLGRKELVARYRSADAFVFASTCENLPIILLEGMASGLPIACSNRGPMPEVLGDAGEYFDAEDPADIARCIRVLFCSPQRREGLARLGYERASSYSWKQCAQLTFKMLADIASEFLADVATKSGK